jgi:hypothetical protein
MSNTIEAFVLPEEPRGVGAAKVEQPNVPREGNREEGKDPRAGLSPGSEQTARDEEEKNRHPASENALNSSQDKNPIPPGSTEI